MQYAAMKLPSKPGTDVFILVDAIETSLVYQALEAGNIDFISMQEAPEDYEKHYDLRILYGRYKVMLDHSLSEEEIKEDLQSGMNVWLAYAHSDQTIHHMGMEDIVILDDILGNGDRVFVALAYTSKAFNITKTRAVTAFIKYFNIDNIINNILNRKGLYAFCGEENRIKKEIPLDKHNWQSFIDYERAIKLAHKVK